VPLARQLNARTAGIAAVSFALGIGFAAQAAETYLPACYKPAAGNTKSIQYAAKKGPYRLALVNGHVGIPWRMQMIQQSRAWAMRPENAANIKELKVVSTGPDVAAQIAAVDNFIQAGYDAIAFIAVNPKAFDAVIRRAKQAGVVLVSFDNPVDNPDIVRITPEWIEFEGDIKARAVVDLMAQKKGRILEIRGIAGNSTDRDRHEGVRKILAKYPDIKVVEVTGNWDSGTVQKVTSDAIAVNGTFDGFICQHGCRGVTSAMKAANHPPVPVGGDAENGFVKALIEQKIPGISVSTSPGQGPVAMAATVALLQGQALPALVNLPTPHTLTRDMKPGVNYFPDLPDSYETVSSYASCGITFTPAEINKFDAENN
jgi:ribose transport system substrate-binding protein